ncbi:hypothetical protein Tco_1078343 [Tanacetum coccineum]|uniref:Retrotransposon gag domain-containing protein n=1 Tax=Tanacetum coccineum TaxID=301880 RepID=A0ABQ5HQS0_9ASTR
MMYERPPTNPFQNLPRNTTFPFQNNILMFQQHQDESLYDAWTRFKNLIQRVPHHGLDLWSLAQFFCDHVNRYTQIDIDHAAGGNLRVLSAEEAWETIEDYAQCDKQWKNPTSTIPDQTIANLKTQLVENEVVRVKIPKCMAWLDDEPIRDLNTMEDKVDNPSPQSTLQVLPSFEVEPLNKTKLEEVGLNCNHNNPLSSREDHNFDKPELQSQPSLNCPPLDASLGTERGFKPPIKPQSPDSFRMKVLDTPPSSLVASFHLKDLYCYYRPCVDDPKKHYGFKSGLLGHSGSLGVDFSKLRMIGDGWKLESEEVSLLGKGLNSPVRPKFAEKVRINETRHLEHVIFDEKKLESS